MTPAKEDRREPQKPASSQKWVTRQVRYPPGTLAARPLAAWMREMLRANALTRSSRRGTHVAVDPLHVASYPVAS